MKRSDNYRRRVEDSSCLRNAATATARRAEADRGPTAFRPTRTTSTGGKSFAPNARPRTFRRPLWSAGADCQISRLLRPQGAWAGGREKGAGDICRKVAGTHDGGGVEVWATGEPFA